MRSIGATVKRFLTAEEIPRWFGLSVVLIYLVGIGFVTHFGVVRARTEKFDYVQRSGEYVVRLLGKRLEALASNHVSEGAGEKWATAFQGELRGLAEYLPVDSVRVVDKDDNIVASLQLDELGVRRVRDFAPGSDFLTTVPGEVVGTGVLHRVPIRISSSASGDASGPHQGSTPGKGKGREASEGDGAVAVDADPDTVGQETVLFLEVRLPSEPPYVTSLGDHARVLAVVLVVLGALFVVYRCLRGQMRGASRIAEQLKSHRECLSDEIDSLRIADTVDTVTTAWNELIDLTQQLSQTVERSEADKELSQVLQQSGGGALAEALDCLPDGIIYITDEVQFEFVNASALRLLGWHEDAEGGHKYTTLADACAEGVGTRILDLIRDSLQADGAYKTNSEILQEEDGQDESSSYRVYVIALPRTQRSGECVVVIRDVSQQLRAERSREEFITQVTHELRTPLTNIRAYAETLSSGMFDDPAVITECYNVITKETRRLSRLIEDILSVSQLDVGTIELHLGQVDLKTLLSEGIRDVRGLADEKNIDLQLVLPAKLEPLHADRDKLNVVINNLLGNAIKYTPANGNIIVGCQCTADEVAITFKDNGIGIDPCEHARVFEKFQRSKDPAVQEEPGTGIGLYTAREIVRHHHGDIDLISEKGQGSTFLVRLPRQATRATTLTTVEEA